MVAWMNDDTVNALLVLGAYWGVTGALALAFYVLWHE